MANKERSDGSNVFKISEPAGEEDNQDASTGVIDDGLPRCGEKLLKSQTSPQSLPPVRNREVLMMTDEDDWVKGLDANRYATKKTVAQGMLDIALLTSNASQLKYVMQVGPKHEFYMLLLVLISISIILQVAMGFVLLTLNLLHDCRFHQPRHRTSALNINYGTTSVAFVVTVLNILVSAFDSSLARYIELDY